MSSFEKINGRFGFGCMRLPEKNGKVDLAEFSNMADEYLANGFNYFDTAFGYHNGESEIAIRECVVNRYKRESFLLANKLTTHFFAREDEVLPLFETQLKKCGVDYFDFYLLHAMCDEYHKKFKQLNVYEKLLKLKSEGKIKHLGMSFHDRAFVLDKLLEELPYVEFVQLQFNYWDYEDVAVESKKCYEVCVKHKKPIFVMEPIKGGRLADLKAEAKKEYDKHFVDALESETALRFVASFDEIRLILSGMSNLEQVRQNVALMMDIKPLKNDEMESALSIGKVLRSLDVVPCTGCRYCMDVCPRGIEIPSVISAFNAKKLGEASAETLYRKATANGNKAIDCLKCGKCEAVCPQHIEIREHLKKSARVFDKSPDNLKF